MLVGTKNTSSYTESKYLLTASYISSVIYCAVKFKGSLTMQVGWKAYEIRLQEYLKVCDFLRKQYTVREMKAMHYTCLGMLYRAVQDLGYHSKGHDSRRCLWSRGSAVENV